MKTAIFGLGVSAKSVIKYHITHKADEHFYIVNQGEPNSWKDQVQLKGDFTCIAQDDFQSIFKEINLIILSPGIPTQLPILQAAQKEGIEIISEIEFAFRLSSVPVIAVTGTSGKTTVCEMMAKALSDCEKSVFLGGNIGHAYTEILMDDTSYDYAVIEVSSFQLETINTFKPIISIITNITPSHMERYDHFNDYKKAKENIFKNNNDGLVLSKMDFSIANQKMPEKLSYNFEQAIALGEHNQENFSYIYESLKYLRLLDQLDFQKFINEFTPSPYRIQKIREIDGCVFINDGKSTNLDSTLAALNSFKFSHGILIMGGKIRDKSIDFEKLNLFKAKVEVMAFGDAATYIAESLNQNFKVKVFENLEALFGDLKFDGEELVLFSPCFPSFDLYKNYIERAEHFNQLVNTL